MGEISDTLEIISDAYGILKAKIRLLSSGLTKDLAIDIVSATFLLLFSVVGLLIVSRLRYITVIVLVWIIVYFAGPD